jgi:hypothetical protein
VRSKIFFLVASTLAVTLLGCGWTRTRQFRCKECQRPPTVAGWTLKFDVTAYENVLRPKPDTSWWDNSYMVDLDLSLPKGKKDTLLGRISFPLIDTIRVVQIPGGQTDTLVPYHLYWISMHYDKILHRVMSYSGLEGTKSTLIPNSVDSVYLEFDAKLVAGEHTYHPVEIFREQDTVIQLSDSVMARFPMRLKFVRHESKWLVFTPLIND